MDVVKALNHVHSNVDTENQWKRAVNSIGKLTNLEKAKAWLEFSEPAARLEYAKAIIAHSQRRELFERCVNESNLQFSVEEVPAGGAEGSLLKETKNELQNCRSMLNRLAQLVSHISVLFKLKPVTEGVESASNGGINLDTGTNTVGPIAGGIDNAKLNQYLQKSDENQKHIEFLDKKYTELHENFAQLTEHLGNLLTLTQANSKNLTDSNQSLSSDFQSRLDSLRAEIDMKLKELASTSSQHMPQENGIDDTPIRPVATSTEIIEIKEKLESILSDITRLKERFSALEAVKFTGIALAIGKEKRMKKIPANIIYNPLTGARRKTNEDSPFTLDELNGEFLSRISYLKELKTKLRTSTVENYMQETDAKLKIALSRKVSTHPTSSASAPTPPASP